MTQVQALCILDKLSPLSNVSKLKSPLWLSYLIILFNFLLPTHFFLLLLNSVRVVDISVWCLLFVFEIGSHVV